MNITIHRGGKQIGGCITEIATEGCKIFIDFGSNLPGCEGEELNEEEIEKIASGADAIFYTHYHGDHIGLHHLIPPHIEQYMGDGAKEVMLCKYKALGKHLDLTQAISAINKVKTYQPNIPIDVGMKGKIKVTPYFVSHSAFDAYMFKIECEGKVILHTGDFRGHGYLSKGLKNTLKNHIHQVDILITEGTMLGRREEKVLKEIDIKNNVVKALREHKYLFALCSSTDLERLASFHSACKDTKRVFLVDGYQKELLDIFSKYAGAKTPWFCFDKVFQLINPKNEKMKWKLQREGFLMPIRASQERIIKEMLETYQDESPWLIYSMWDGYAKEGKEYTNEKIIQIRNFFGEHILDGVKDGVHTSGHADVNTLKEVCQEVNPRIGVIPIHKEKDSKYETFSDVHCKIFKEGEEMIDNLSVSIQ